MAKLALKGGTPVRTEAFEKWPVYDEKERQALDRVLTSGKWGTLGPEVDKFSKRFSEYQQARHGLCITNGTVTLEVILRGLGIGFGDEVIIPPYTFNATASSVVFVGATPVFADIESDTYNIDPDKVEKAITSRTKAIIPVHVGGRTADMDRIMEIAKRHNLYVIEDCAHAHGSEWRGKRVGSMGHAGSFSFQASKNLTSGEGGFITVNDDSIYEMLWSIHHCGRDMKGLVWYGHSNIGTNARMTEWQAAILDAQMDRLDGQIAVRSENAAYLNSKLSQIACTQPLKHDDRITRNSYHLFIFKFISECCKGLTRDKFLEALRAEGIPCAAGYVSLYKQPLFHGEAMKRATGSNINYKEMYLENCEKAEASEGVWLTQNMLLGGKKDMDDIANAIAKICENADELL